MPRLRPSSSAASGDSRGGTPARLTHWLSSPSPGGMLHLHQLLPEMMKKTPEVCSRGDVLCHFKPPHTPVC